MRHHALVLVTLCLGLFVLFACAPRLVLEPVQFQHLQGWRGNHLAALTAFLKTCEKFSALPEDYSLGVAGTVAHWRHACEMAPRFYNEDKEGDARARRFFEAYFAPYKAYNRVNSQGIFTGYYEAALRGSRSKHGPYQYPLYARPPDLVNGQPYLSREKIEAGALAGKGLELLYVDDPVEAFFLQVQGSGRVLLDDGTTVRVGYNGKNGCEYYSIGRYLIQEGEFTRDEVTADKVKQWLRDHPERAQEVMNMNQAFVFFRELPEGDGPIGAQEVALTPEASLAVDKKFIPFGVPVWLQTTMPPKEDAQVGEEQQEAPYHRLLIAQDTGTAIQGPVRGDIFFGYGARAQKLASNMKQNGEYFLLLPKTVAIDPIFLKDY